MYTVFCCDMIAMKREVAADREVLQVVPWSEGHVELTTSHCTGKVLFI